MQCVKGFQHASNFQSLSACAVWSNSSDVDRLLFLFLFSCTTLVKVCLSDAVRYNKPTEELLHRPNAVLSFIFSTRCQNQTPCYILGRFCPAKPKIEPHNQPLKPHTEILDTLNTLNTLHTPNTQKHPKTPQIEGVPGLRPATPS